MFSSSQSTRLSPPAEHHPRPSRSYTEHKFPDIWEADLRVSPGSRILEQIQSFSAPNHTLNENQNLVRIQRTSERNYPREFRRLDQGRNALRDIYSGQTTEGTREGKTEDGLDRETGRSTGIIRVGSSLLDEEEQ